MLLFLVLVKTERQGIRYLCEELSDAWQWDLAMEVEHELKLNHTEMSMIRWMCRVKLNERKKSEELWELLGLEVCLMDKKGQSVWWSKRVGWDGLEWHVERKDDNDWVKRCITWEVEGIRQRGRRKKTWWDCVKNDMESLGLSQKDAQSRNKWRRGQPANPGSPRKMAVKTGVCVRACVQLYLYFCYIFWQQCC